MDYYFGGEDFCLGGYWYGECDDEVCDDCCEVWYEE